MYFESNKCSPGEHNTLLKKNFEILLIVSMYVFCALGYILLLHILWHNIYVCLCRATLKKQFPNWIWIFIRIWPQRCVIEGSVIIYANLNRSNDFLWLRNEILLCVHSASFFSVHRPWRQTCRIKCLLCVWIISTSCKYDVTFSGW